MGKIHIEFDTQCDKGDVVVFKKDDHLQIGIVEGYYVDRNAGDSVWYNVRINPSSVYTYSNEGDIAEWDIKMKLEDVEDIKRFITNGEED